MLLLLICLKIVGICTADTQSLQSLVHMCLGYTAGRLTGCCVPLPTKMCPGRMGSAWKCYSSILGCMFDRWCWNWLAELWSRYLLDTPLHSICCSSILLRTRCNPSLHWLLCLLCSTRCRMRCRLLMSSCQSLLSMCRNCKLDTFGSPRNNQHCTGKTMSSCC